MSGPATMRVMRATRLCIDALEIVHTPVPVPAAGEILVRIKAVTLNSRDVAVLTGRYPAEVRTPLIPASDACGQVVAIGPGTTRFRVGERVIPVFTQGWLAGMPTPGMRLERMLGVPLDGVLREYVTLSEEDAVACPEHLSDVEAAALPVAALTAWNVLQAGRVAPGSTVLLLGTGSVSLFALQFAKLAGAKVVVTSASDDKLRRMAELGADRTVNRCTEPDWPAAVRAAFDGRGADIVVETAGTLAQSLRAAAFGAFVGVVGYTGAFDEPFDLRHLIGGLTRLQGFAPGSRASFEAMNRAIAAHRLRPVIDRTFRFDDTPQALRHLALGAHVGKVAISL